ncbi:4-hydroxy-tetrahydrodipicolinate synthase [Weissella confusa]|uniref:4-hydroxy-tetrahydrodipicolinate synthase n=1 Tax=Weissella confusa TaxID=1583 RepID=UPI00107F1FB2|nr:4-hydroxy-tetrahydrodipicolinate synthase [Weissella confusa]MBJ7617231.1 4-hydroxy-tetrahydrodipicolinate synthase [Weissella confusa]MBJ7623654.1 4-hydroxy-tetrahydrodipicolinate synthase [Weissella confusa]MBJ7656730.1 4-hydroxy-tetrahydrodipicolinate synthase [Weissella confusa]MBJ7664706.1 4-hydroxy-tetrahydrodipicolinate synthase [Weissella confusa]MBJ7675238.1 4-hydroxy-tetrahydrodipicolinate synthase [Weissella confusa]
MYENIELITAIITPFTANDQIDYVALDRLADRLLHDGTQGFVIGGTTGESPTLTHDEKIALYTHFAAHIGNRGVVVANVGDNNTAHSVALAKEVSAIPGVDGLLAVTPYYNKPSQAGMIAHFTAIADASSVPVMLYNIPGRSAVGLTNESVVTLAQHPMINAVKQVTTIDDLAFLVGHTPADFAVYTGEDAQTLAAKVVGATGTISVAAHVYSREMADLFAAVAEGNIETAGRLQRWLTPRMNAFFRYPSPSPVKAVLAQRGEIENTTRLPILPLTDVELADVQATLNEKDD